MKITFELTEKEVIGLINAVKGRNESNIDLNEMVQFIKVSLQKAPI